MNAMTDSKYDVCRYRRNDCSLRKLRKTHQNICLQGRVVGPSMVKFLFPGQQQYNLARQSYSPKLHIQFRFSPPLQIYYDRSLRANSIQRIYIVLILIARPLNIKMGKCK